MRKNASRQLAETGHWHCIGEALKVLRITNKEFHHTAHAMTCSKIIISDLTTTAAAEPDTETTSSSCEETRRDVFILDTAPPPPGLRNPHLNPINHCKWPNITGVMLWKVWSVSMLDRVTGVFIQRRCGWELQSADTRASNEPSRRLKFYNHGKGPYRAFSWLKAPTIDYDI